MILNYPNFSTNPGYDNDYEFRTYIEKINLDEECLNDIKTGKGFYIIQTQNIKKDIKEPNGIFSPRFGQTLGDLNPFQDRYKCDCGFTVGKIEDNTTCPICGTKVRRVDDSYDTFGWIKLKQDYCVIHPGMFKEIQSLIGAETLIAILNPVDLKDADGFSIKSKVNKNDPYIGKGMFFFRDHFDEIIKYYYSKSQNKKNKIEIYSDILTNRDKVFTHSIPVYTTLLRPFQLNGKEFSYNDANGIYQMMAKLASMINKDKLVMDRKLKPKKQLMFDLQNKFNQLYDEIELIISGKKGTFRQTFGGRCNFTSRNVIIPGPTLRTDEVHLSYFALVGMLEQRIINILKSGYNMSYDEAYNKWYYATISIDPMVKSIIQSIIDSYPRGIPCIINRNPTIAYGSCLFMYITGILDVYCMAVPLQVLPLLAADFDGDVMNIMLIINKSFEREACKKFSPRNAFYISRNDGLFNNDMNHARDVIINMNTILGLSRDRYTPEMLEKIRRIKEKNNQKVFF